MDSGLTSGSLLFFSCCEKREYQPENFRVICESHASPVVILVTQDIYNKPISNMSFVPTLATQCWYFFQWRQKNYVCLKFSRNEFPTKMIFHHEDSLWNFQGDWLLSLCWSIIGDNNNRFLGGLSLPLKIQDGTETLNTYFQEKFYLLNSTYMHLKNAMVMGFWRLDNNLHGFAFLFCAIHISLWGCFLRTRLQL